MSWLPHLWHGANQEASRGNNMFAGIVLVVAGFFLAPMLIGIPMMLVGIAYLLGWKGK